MTSLAKQLQQYSLPHTQLVFAEDKRRKSLLFDPKEAAALDKETFYALGINGLDELQTLDPVFKDFELNIFAESSVSFERSVQTKEINDRLDENVSRFLSYLSPYCLIKPAHKVLEWLIYRYHIHIYNVDDLVMCVLPFHGSNIFVRIIQLLQLDSKTASAWDWLEPIQKSGVHLARASLINHCRTNTGFLSFLCNMVQKNTKIHLEDADNIPKLRALYFLYATTVIGVIESGTVTENLISSLIPHLSVGLKSKVMDYKAATYMVLAQLFYNVKLKQELIHTLLNTTCKHLSVQLISEALSCILLMFQTQELSSLTKRSFKYLCRQPGLEGFISSLSENYKCDKLLRALMDKVIPAAIKQNADIASSSCDGSDSESEGGLIKYADLLHRLTCNIHMNDVVAEHTARQLLKSYIKYGKKMNYDEDTQSWNTQLRNVLRLMEGRYPASVEKVINEVLAEAQSEDRKNLVQEFLNLSVLSSQYHISEDSSTSLTLSLNHRLPIVRQSAVKHLLCNSDLMRDDSSYVCEAVLTRLIDDSPVVVETVLHNSQFLWSLMDDKKILIERIGHVLARADASKQWEVAGGLALKMLGECEAVADIEIDVLCLLLPNLLILTDNKEEKLSQVQHLLKLPFSKKNHLLSYIAKNWKMHQSPKKLPNLKGNKLSDLNMNVVELISKGLMEHRQKERGFLIHNLCEKSLSSRERFKLLMLLVIDKLVTMVTSQAEVLELCHHQMPLIRILKTEKRKVDSLDLVQSFEKCLDETFESLKEKASIPLCLKTVLIHKLISVIKIPRPLLTDVKFWEYKEDGSASSKFLALSICILDFLSDNATNKTSNFQLFGHTLAEFMQVFLQQKVLFKFLAFAWTQHCDDRNYKKKTGELQARALQLCKQHLKIMVDGEYEDMTSALTVMVNLLFVMSSRHKALREVALDCLESLLVILKRNHLAFIPIVKKVIRSREEIEADAEYLQVVMKSVFRTVTKGDKGTSPKTSEKQAVKKEALHELIDITVHKDTPHYIQRSLLQMLQLHNNHGVLTELLPLLKKLLMDAKHKHFKNPAVFDCICLILERYTQETVSVLTPDGSAIELLLEAMSCKISCCSRNQLIQEVAINQITKEFFNYLQLESQMKIFAGLVDILLSSDNPGTLSTVRNTIKHISLNAAVAALELQSTLKMPDVGSIKEAKRRSIHMAVDKAKTDFESQSWQRVTVILECVLNGKKWINFTELLPVCFHLLTRVIESDHHATTEYIKQLLLSVIHRACCQVSEGEKTQELIPEQKFNMEQIIQCIRTSDNPQTHHQALLVLTTVAQMYPEKLLHNIMSVFTFMGANILRQDDEYSFKIIGRILETVIPALVTACEQRTKIPKTVSNRIEDIITMVIRVFVDAYPHIPEHRRITMFVKLVQIVGEKSYLWCTLLLLIDYIVSKDAQPVANTGNLEESMRSVGVTEFCLQLCNHFSPMVSLTTGSSIINYISALPDEKEDDSSVERMKRTKCLGKLNKEDAELFNVSLHTAKQLRHFKYEGVLLLIRVYSDLQFINQVTLSRDENLLNEFLILLEAILKCATHFTENANKYSNKPSAKFWKALLSKVHDLLDKVVGILPESMFIEVVSDLLNHSLSTIQRKTMELLNNKLHQHKQPLLQHEEALLLPLVDQLTDILAITVLSDEDTDFERGQTALYSLKLLCRHLGTNNPHTFLKVLKIGTEVFSKQEFSLQLSACALLCIAEICNTIKVHVVPHLSSFVPLILSSMKNEEILFGNELYLLSTVTALQKVVENLSHFLSPYLSDIIQQVCCLDCWKPDQEMKQKSQLQQRLKIIRSTIATTLPPRVILPLLTACYNVLAGSNKNCIKPLMSLLVEHMSCMTKEDLNSHINQIQMFFLECLNYRISYSQVGHKTVEEVESHVIECIVSLVMKLSELTFKSFFFKLYDWVTREDADKLRVLVFYRLAESLAEKLRSLFSLFAANIFRHAAITLDNNNISKGKPFYGKKKEARKLSRQLLFYILGCLHKCFMYDTEGIINKEQFDSLMQPLVDQIENEIGNEKCYEKLITEYLCPCIIQFGVTTQDDALWRSLNYQILLKTRHGSPKVRIATLHIINEFHKKLGEDYMTLLPETIPFLAEMMEDESEEVEKKCQSVISEMEKTLGEPLHKYF